MRYQFAPAAPDEQTVYGACRPGRMDRDTSDEAISDWIGYMRANRIDRVCCLLDDAETLYTDLIGTYEGAFGPQNVCHSPISDYDTVSEEALINSILPFLDATDRADERVVVHCSAGKGRTGHVLALWLAAHRNYNIDEAVETVIAMNRRPREAATKAELRQLLKRYEQTNSN